jgi:hypothetical protein
MATVEDKRHGDTRRSWGYVVFVDGARSSRRSRGSRRAGRRMVAVAVRDRRQASDVIEHGLVRRGMRNPKLVTRIEDLPSRKADRVVVVDEKVAPRWYVAARK